MSSKIDSLIAEFAKNLRAAIAQEAAAAFATVAMGHEVGNAHRGKPGPKPKGGAATKASGKRSRRGPEDIAKQATAILSYVKKNAGSKAETIGKALGMTSLEMQIPIAQLLSEKKLGKKGERRATTYHAR